MTTRRVRLLCFTVVLFLFVGFTGLCLPGVRMVRLSLAQGDVQIDRNSGRGWEQAIDQHACHRRSAHLRRRKFQSRA